MSELIIGLTGGIATGKSTVSQQFKHLGINIVDADLIARQVVEPGSDALAQIAKYFGDGILNADQSLNRAKLREIIFSDSSSTNSSVNSAVNSGAKQWLNDLLHPIIRLEITHQLESATSPYVILDAPLLFENKLDAICHSSVLVDIPERLQIKRATQRDSVTSEQIKQIIDAQMPSTLKRDKADHIIDNSGTIDNTIVQVNALHNTFIEHANR
jgi:dephospho-CoA kinase